MTDRRTVFTVVVLLGTIALVCVTGEIWLVREIVHQGAGAGTVDPAAVAAVGGIGTLGGTTIGSLGTLLVSTRSGGGNEEPQPVTVVEQRTVETTPVA
jgi:hypothetical protein